MSLSIRLALLALFLQSYALFAQFAWQGVIEPVRNDRQIIPASYRTVGIDGNALRDYLMQAPHENTVTAKNSDFILELPMPDGTQQRFSLVYSPIMEEGLAAQFPEIRTYLGQGIDDRTAILRCDFTPKGFHGIVIGQSGSIYIDPYAPGETDVYIAYRKTDFYSTTSKVFDELPPVYSDLELPENNEKSIDEKEGKKPKPDATLRLVQPMGFQKMTPFGTQLRQYRLALACTGEYATFHGGTVAGALAAMVTSVNRVNGIYERDASIRMNIIANNNLIIYLNGVTDPYTNNNGATMLNENQTNIDAVIGSANYDIGHVFSTGGGGIAQLNSPCGSGKARGVTGSGAPVGDPFDVDYVAHEIGHQFGGNHTQNNSCNRASSAAYEPGSATTIMGYAGICPPNLQSNSDDHFHNHSINEIHGFAVSGNGNTCAAISSTGNTVPTVEAGVGGWTIPISTPFELTAVGSDADGDLITYNWEQYDLGPATAVDDNTLTNPSGNQPIFRSWPSAISPTRVFPRIQDLVNNTTVIGELLPTYTRSLRFRCTVRDNNAGAGGVQDDEVLFNVSAAAGPFVVTVPNTAVSWAANSTQTVTWNVANTQNAPVNATNVDIFLSTDGGFTYPILLLQNTPNDGSAAVAFPNVSTSQARIKVKGGGNIFFDISNTNFTISAGSLLTNDIAFGGVVNPAGIICQTPIVPSILVTNNGSNTVTSFTVTYDINGGPSQVFNWTGSLSAGATETVTLPSVTSGSGSFVFNASLSLPNGVTDSDTSDNSGSAAFSNCTVPGCTNPSACNYNASANSDDGSCTFGPSNDACAGAIALVANAAASTVTNAASCVEIANPTCGNAGQQMRDIWFSFVYTGGNIVVRTSVATGIPLLTDTRLAVYTSCGGTQIACSDDISGSNFYSSISLNCAQLDQGVTYYVRAGGYNNLTGLFNIEVDLTNVNGCTNPLASNYNECANVNDGSCIIPGCTNPAACNFNSEATQDDGSCTLPQTWYLNADGDLFAISTTTSCTNPGAGYTSSPLPLGDCNDSNAAIFPGATEVCDGVDNDCDGLNNEGLGINWYIDSDGDGFGAGAAVVACSSPGPNYVLNTTDCNNSDNTVYPGAPEICDTQDNDCDGLTDEGIATQNWYFDGDGDGVGGGSPVSACVSPGAGWVLTSGDCNDSNNAIYPLNTEICDGFDNDCDGFTDEGVGSNWYLDNDGDGYGSGTAVVACTQPGLNYSLLSGDCNNSNANVYPGAPEICDGLDNDCDTGVDEGLPLLAWYLDNDGDLNAEGFTSNCGSPGAGWSNTVIPIGDCNGNNALIYPGAPELCDGLDNDCDGLTDEGCPATNVPNDNRPFAQIVTPQPFGVCTTTGGTVNGATVSPECTSTVITGEDVWYRFTANSAGVRIVAQTTAFDAVIELQDNAGNTIATENVVSGVGTEILNHYDALNPLVSGATYFIAVRNFNSSQGTGTFGVCVQRLRATTCNFGPGPYQTCNAFKAVFVAAQSYTFTFTNQTTSAVTNVTTSNGITTTNLSALLPGFNYSVGITATYQLADGAGNPEVIAISTPNACSIVMAPHTNIELRSLDWCSAGPKASFATLTANTWLCGAANYEWRFKQTSPVLDVDYGPAYSGPGISRLFFPGFLGLQPGATYDVEVRPVYPGPFNGNWSNTPRCLGIIGNSSAQQQDETYLPGIAHQTQLMVQPNPSDGERIRMVTDIPADEEVMVQVMDAGGRIVYTTRWVSQGETRHELVFPNTLMPGVYMLRVNSDSGSQSVRMVIAR
jgi:hypothetical protein